MAERLAENVRAGLGGGAFALIGCRAVKLTVLLESTSPPGSSMSLSELQLGGKTSE